MKTERSVSIIFAASGIYDAGLGLIFLLAPAAMYGRFHVTPPNHWGYVQFGAAMLIIFGLMFLQVAFKPAANRNLIPYGILLKVAYAGTVFAYWFTQGLPDMWKPFAFCDAVFAFLFAWAWVRLAPGH
ncbi:MAG: hypothetical protein ABSB58_02870 [Gemmatimonadales bacterium]|jgi:hypothetical protein